MLKEGRTAVAIEVKSGRAPLAHSGLAAFTEAFKPKRMLLVGGDGIPVAEFLSRPATDWLHPCARRGQPLGPSRRAK